MMRWVPRLAAAMTAVGCVAAGVAGAVPTQRPQPGRLGALAPVLTSSSQVAAVTAGQAAQPAAPPSRAAPRKGVSAWSFSGVSRALARSGASWYFTWSSGHQNIASPPGVQFVPMIWGVGSVTAATLGQVRHEGRYLLGFNEPDMASQSNLSVSTALHLWPRLMATGMRLGSPAVATGAATPGGWLDRFMRGAAARGYRVSFITVHWYGSDFATGPAVRQLRDYLQAIHDRYHRPVWLTEFALINFGTVTRFPSPRLQAAFVTAATSMLDHLSWVQRYAWFALPVAPIDGTAGLFRRGAVATPAGRAFEAADPNGSRR